MEADRKLLRAKIQRMKKTIQNRNTSIKKVLAQPQNEQSIQTASQSTIQQLREEKVSLENALEISQQELEELRKSDKLAMSDELKIEIPLFFQEKKRLDDQLANSKDIENVLAQELNRLQNQVSSINSNEMAVDEIQVDIDSLTEKLLAYRKSEMKLIAAKDLHKLHKNPASYDEVKSKLQKEIKDVKKEIEQSNQDIAEIQESEDQNMEYLNEIIQRQIQTIKKCLQKMDNEEEDADNDQDDTQEYQNDQNNEEYENMNEKNDNKARHNTEDERNPDSTPEKEDETESETISESESSNEIKQKEDTIENQAAKDQKTENDTPENDAAGSQENNENQEDDNKTQNNENQENNNKDEQENNNREEQNKEEND
ncbi:hypothetical protein TRFO_24451 [Tritrichomonas foetus]|uniref:Uncharacterized protein n=1 Tax=Tritrichomonas foetus TaxID=1144522 RepID=A0A1J4KCJ1_9EUKA|nr:hypothetical protein TRFO_24451 [Tritrichomonas foetus]|eukprot:OHT07366.1 hypothetical protein TRFO_24451 [Tritrichomonas foetus]